MESKLLHALVVDDDPDDRLLASVALKRSGRFTKVSLSSGGRHGLSSLGHAPPPPPPLSPSPDVVFLDLSMPGLDGHAVMTELATMGPVPPVIVLTSSSNPIDKQRSFEHAFVRGYEEKPLTVTRAQAIADLL